MIHSVDAGSRPVVVFGDSTTAPRGEIPVYADLLQKTLRSRKSRIRVINAGVRGNTTRLARTRFEKDVLAKDAGLVVIQFGINDAAMDVWKDPPATAPRVSLPQFRANLEFFIDAIRCRSAGVILMTPNRLRWTPALLEKYGKSPYQSEAEEGFNVFLDRYADAVRQIAGSKQVRVADVHAAYAKMSGDEVDSLLLDGIHPNAKGHELVHQVLLAAADLILR